MSSKLHEIKPLIFVYRRMYSAMVSGNVASLQELLHEKFELVHITGYIQKRSEWLQHIASGEMQYFSSQEEAITGNSGKDAGFLCGRNVVNAQIWGAIGEWRLQLEIDMVRSDGKWRMTHAVASTY